jgi:hypothetical protein
MVDDARQVGVRQVAQDLRLALELALRCGGSLQVFLQGARALQVDIQARYTAPKPPCPSSLTMR